MHICHCIVTNMSNNTNPTYKFLCSVTPAFTSSSKKRPRSSSETVSHWSDEEIVADDGLDSWKGLVNRDGEAVQVRGTDQEEARFYQAQRCELKV